MKKYLGYHFGRSNRFWLFLMKITIQVVIFSRLGQNFLRPFFNALKNKKVNVFQEKSPPGTRAETHSFEFFPIREKDDRFRKKLQLKGGIVRNRFYRMEFSSQLKKRIGERETQ